MLFQWLGAVCGMLVAYNLLEYSGPVGIGYSKNGNWFFSQAMFREFLGSTILVFMYLSQTDKKTKLAQDPAITAMLISASWVCSMNIGLKIGSEAATPVNPAIAIATISS